MAMFIQDCVCCELAWPGRAGRFVESRSNVRRTPKAKKFQVAALLRRGSHRESFPTR
jgi:hypothetical protein